MPATKKPALADLLKDYEEIDAEIGELLYERAKVATVIAFHYGDSRELHGRFKLSAPRLEKKLPR
jgi:hypothetical protein